MNLANNPNIGHTTKETLETVAEGFGALAVLLSSTNEGNALYRLMAPLIQAIEYEAIRAK